MPDSWLAANADEIQKYADTHDSKRFYDALKAVYGPQSSSTSSLLNVDGTTLITDKPSILNMWAEQFSAVLNRPAFINAEAITRLPQVETNTDLDKPPSEEEVMKAIKQLSTGKAPGADDIPAEMYKHGGNTLLQKLTNLFCRMWDEEVIPQQLKGASITCLYKKGNRQLCDNYRGIPILAIAGKILIRMLLNRLIVQLEHGLLPESQCGFRGGRVTVDMIFAARQLQEKCQKQCDDLFITFIDLTKACDTVCRDGPWQIMEKFGCPRKSTALVRQLHDGMRATVLDNGDTSDSFPVTNEVKQDCVLAPTLFSMVFAAMLHDASQDNDDGIQLKYRTDGGVFNLRRLKAKTKVKVATLRELLFADDCALNSNTEAEMQQCVNHFSRDCDNFGFTISTKNTEFVHQPAPRKMYHEPHIFVNDEPLKATDSFTYPGSTLPREANIDVEVNNRLSKANSAFGRLRKKVWDRRGISQETKLKVYMAVVLTVLLYACESWTVYSGHARKLNHFHTKCLRIILSIKWQDMVPDTEVLTRAGTPSIHTLLQTAQAGHVTRMPDDRLR